MKTSISPSVLRRVDASFRIQTQSSLYHPKFLATNVPHPLPVLQLLLAVVVLAEKKKYKLSRSLEYDSYDNRKMTPAQLLRVESSSSIVVQLPTGAVIQTTLSPMLDPCVLADLSKSATPITPVPCEIDLGEYKLPAFKFYNSKVSFPGFEPDPNTLHPPSDRMQYKRRRAAL